MYYYKWVLCAYQSTLVSISFCFLLFQNQNLGLFLQGDKAIDKPQLVPLRELRKEEANEKEEEPTDIGNITSPLRV